MRNEGADIVQDTSEEIREHARELKEKARAAGTAALDLTRATYQELHNRTVACSQSADRAIRDNPYLSLAGALGIGLVIGLLINRGGSRETDRC